MTALPPRLFALSGMALEAAVRRGDADEAAAHERFIVAHGRPEETAWLLDAYSNLRVPHELRLVGEKDFRARALVRWPGCDLREVRVDCRRYRERHLSAVNWNAQRGRIGTGWRVLPGDPPARSPSPFSELEETA